MLMASRVDEQPKVTAEHERLLEKSLQLGALLQAIASGHDPMLSSERMSHDRLQALIDVAINVHEELDEAAVAVCKQLSDRENG